jgi:hypothetical protein
MAHNYAGAVQTTRARACASSRSMDRGGGRHGAVPVHEEHPRGQAHRRVQPRATTSATSRTSTTSPRA